MKRLATLLILCLVVLMPAVTEGPGYVLIGSDLMLDDNKLEVSFGEDGLISFATATYFPVEGVSETYSMDITQESWQIHGIGIAIGEKIRQTNDGAYSVEAFCQTPLTIRLGKGGILMTIGAECYSITKPNGTFLVENRPLLPNDTPDPDKCLSYRIALSPTNGFNGPLQSTYAHRRDLLGIGLFDYEAQQVPRSITFVDGLLKAYGYMDQKPDYAQTSYRINFPLSKDKATNLQNLLILLALRRDSPRVPLIHPVLLGIYFYDAIMP